jgi:hypothetical protein
MENDISVTMSLEGRYDLAEISDVSSDERERTTLMEPLEVGIGTGPRQIVKDDEIVPISKKAASGIGADKPCSSSDEPLHVVLLG